MTDILVRWDILGAADPHGATSLVNLYAAMPSLHVVWAAWCATAIVITTRSRWRHLAWLYPAATTLVVLASAKHFLLDAAGGLAWSTPIADARSGGGPKAYGPASCIAPYPDRLLTRPVSNPHLIQVIHRSARLWVREITGTR